jgi:hypothetical protein
VHSWTMHECRRHESDVAFISRFCSCCYSLLLFLFRFILTSYFSCFKFSSSSLLSPLCSSIFFISSAFFIFSFSPSALSSSLSSPAHPSLLFSFSFSISPSFLTFLLSFLFLPPYFHPLLFCLPLLLLLHFYFLVWIV